MAVWLLVAIGSLNVLLGYLIWRRREYGLIAGYDMRRVPDPLRLARWIGVWSIVTGLVCVAAAITAAWLPNRAGLVMRIMSTIVVADVIVMFGGSIRRAR